MTRGARLRLAVSVGGSKCEYALVDAATSAIRAHSRRIEWTSERVDTVEAFVGMLAAHAQRLVRDADVPADTIERVGVAWPGPETDRGFQATFIPGCKTPQPIGALLAAALAARLGPRFHDVPVHVRLDAVGRAAGEARPGGALSGPLLPRGEGGLLVNIATGIAGAVVSDGQALLAFPGIGRNYGQFGRFLFWNVTTRTWAWRPTADGSIRSEASDEVRWTRHGAGPALARRLAAWSRQAGVAVPADQGVAAALRHYEFESAPRDATHEIALLRWATANAYDQPDGALARFVDAVAFEIGTALNTLCGVFAAASITRVVLAGGIGENFGAHRDEMEDRLLAGVHRTLERHVVVERSRMGVDAELVGATSDLFTGAMEGS
jgi:predicted NBD/HSP70 family sugar kinase